MRKYFKNFGFVLLTILMLVVTMNSALASVTQDDLLDGLVSYWKFDENTGTSASDNHSSWTATLDNADIWKSGFINSGVGGGDNDYREVSVHSDFNNEFTNSMSIGFWVKNEDDSSYTDNRRFIGTPRNSGSFIFFMGRSNNEDFGNRLVFHIRVGTSNILLYGSSALVTNEWYHIGVTWNSTNDVELWINGVMVDDAVSSVNLNFDDFSIFPQSNTATSWRGGDLGARDLAIDEVAIYDRALTSDEVQSLYDIQKDGYEDGSYDFQVLLLDNFSVSVTDEWSGADVNNISVIVDGETYTNTTGNTVTTNILNNDTSTYLVQVSANNYFDRNYSNTDVSTTLNAELYQSQIMFEAFEFLSEEQILDFNVTIDSTTKNNSETWYLSANNYTALFLSPNYINQSINFTVSALDIENISFYNVTGSMLNITAKDVWSNNSINNFSGWYYAEEFDFNETFNTTTGEVILNLKRYANYTVFIENPNYAITDDNTKQIFLNESDDSKIFYLFRTNSLDINFKEDNTKELITQSITLELISDDYSYNFTTTNGTLQIEFVVPSTYTFRYRSDGYDEGFYRIAVTDRSYNDLDLYMINSTDSSPVKLTIIDESARAVEGIVVKSLKYDQETNKYLVQEIRTTDFLGETIFNVRKNEEFYRFIIERDGAMIRMTNPSYISADSLTIQVITTDLIGGEYFATLGITASITHNNATGNFRAEYNDESAIGSIYCLKVTKLGRNPVVMGEECSTSPSGVLLFYQPFEENKIYEAELYLKINPIQSLIKYVADWSVPFDSGNMGLIIQILMTIFFAMTFMYNPSVGAIMTPMSILLGRIIGLNTLPWTLITPLIIVGIIIVYLMEK